MARAHSFRKDRVFSRPFSKPTARDSAGFVNLMANMTGREPAPTCDRCGGIVGVFEGPPNAACKCSAEEAR